MSNLIVMFLYRKGEIKRKIHELIIKFFRGKDDYSEFEHFAAKIFELSEITAQHGAVTRYTKDYGRDAYGTLTIGKGWGKCDFDYHLEAKYKSRSGVTVKETSRLISRIFELCMV